MFRSALLILGLLIHAVAGFICIGQSDFCETIRHTIICEQVPVQDDMACCCESAEPESVPCEMACSVPQPPGDCEILCCLLLCQDPMLPVVRSTPPEFPDFEHALAPAPLPETHPQLPTAAIPAIDRWLTYLPESNSRMRRATLCIRTI